MSDILQSKLFNWLWASSLLLVLFIGSIHYHSFDRGFYHHMYTSLDTASSMNIDEAELDTATSVLLDYLQGHRDNLDFQLSDGSMMFNQREIDHMVDVKDLYQASKTVFNISLIIFIICTIYYVQLGLKRAKFIFSQSFKISFIGFGLVILVIGFYVLIDFDSFWTQFHHVFFRNDLWLLDPRTDRLIQMVPLPFFNQLVFRILMSILLGVILIALFVLWNPKKNHPKVHIVLFEPEIPQNTGNVMRTAMATGSTLHLIEPFGFIYDDKRLKRSGMDYIDQIEIIRHDDWNAFIESVQGTIVFITRYGEKSYSEFDFRKEKNDIYLVFGKESTGLPLDLLASNLDYCLRVPMTPEARSLNLSNSVAIVTYEVLRQLDFQDLSLVEVVKGSDWLRKRL